MAAINQQVIDFDIAPAAQSRDQIKSQQQTRGSPQNHSQSFQISHKVADRRYKSGNRFSVSRQRKRDNHSTNFTTKMRFSNAMSTEQTSNKKGSRNAGAHRALSVNKSTGTTTGYFNIRNNSLTTSNFDSSKQKKSQHARFQNHIKQNTFMQVYQNKVIGGPSSKSSHRIGSYSTTKNPNSFRLKI